MAALVSALILVAFVLGYRYYARFIGSRIYHDRDDIVTPAHEFEDGHDFVPTTKHILFGHHFTSIAGAAPIVGPCVAAYWGWLPALLWVVLGTIFMGAVHDFGALVLSVREKGRSIADIAGKVINSRVRVMFLCFVMVVSWLVLSVFAMVIAGLFVAAPSSVLPINVQIIVALAIGILIYKKGVPALVPSLIGLAILYFFVWYGTDHPVDLRVAFDWDDTQAQNAWVIALLVYSGIASLLPVWLLLQPRDYINSHQLVVGLGLLFLGLFLVAPEFDAPAIRTFSEGAPPIFPLLFVTIACGAISGFHGLVASGTTSKQISSLSHARIIGYGSMLGEGALALAATMAAVAGIALVGECVLPGQGAVSDLSWGVYYDSWANAGANKSYAFVAGGGAFLQQVGLSEAVAQTLMAVLVIAFAATTLDTATRIERFIIVELAQSLKIKFLANRYVATLGALIPAAVLVFWSVPTPGGGEETAAAWVLWPIFGGSNQMLAALTLMLLSLYFWRRRRPVLPLLIPMLFIMVITLTALIYNTAGLIDFTELSVSNWPMLSLNVILLTLILWMIVEGLTLFMRGRDAPEAPDAPDSA